MKTQLHHTALNVNNFDWYVLFFEEVFEMTTRKSTGTAPDRKIWFHQGIQLNECTPKVSHGSVYDHLGISVDNQKAVVSRALEKGCTVFPDKANWIQLPDGIVIELM